MSIGERLKIARERKNLKQIQVMKQTGINNKTLSGYENGISQPDYISLKKLANLYEVSLDVLITGIDEQKDLHGEVKEMRQLRKDSYENQEKLNSTIGELLHLFTNNNELFKEEYEEDIFYLFEGCIGTYEYSLSDYERFDRMYRGYRVNKQEDPAYIDEQFDEEFTKYYNRSAIMEGVRGTKSYEWKEMVISKLVDLAHENNISNSDLGSITDKDKTIDFSDSHLRLENILNEEKLTYHNQRLTLPERQRILDMLKILFPDRQNT